MRRFGFSGCVAAAVLVALPLAAWAQDEGESKLPPVDKAKQAEMDKQEKEAKERVSKAIELMRASAQAMTDVTSLSFNAETYGVGGQGLRVPEMKATGIAKRGGKKDALGWKFRIDGKAGSDSHPVLAAYDGTTVRSVRPGDKKMLEAPGSNAGEALDDGSGAAMGWLLRWKDLVVSRFAEGDNTPACRIDGKADVAGVPCDVVYVDYSESSDPNLFDAWWYLGVDDHLPRRLDLHLVSNTIGDGFVVVKISNVKPGAAAADSVFALAAPDGFEVVKAKEPEHEEGIGRAVKVSTLAVGQPAPDWELLDPDGKKHRLSDYAGKVVVMDFWATWCGPCQMAMPGVQAVHEEFKGKPVAVFGMNCWESADPVKLMKEKGYTYGLLLKADSVAKDYGVSGIPTFYVIGKDGKIAYVGVGFNPAGEKQLSDIITQELAKPAGQ